MDVVLHQSAPLRGCEKVAALLLALDRDLAHSVLRRFDQKELRQIAKCAANLGTVSAEIINPLIREFAAQLMLDARDIEGSSNEAEQLIDGVVPPDQVADIMSHVLGNSNRFFWDRLTTLDPAMVSDYLLGEDPQTIGVVIQKLDPAYSAKILQRLPGELRDESVKRALRGRQVPDAALRIIESTIQTDLLGDAPRAASPAAASHIAGILNRMEREESEKMLDNIAQAEPAIVQELRSRLFGFEDISSLSLRARTIIFDQVATDRLILALDGADASIMDAVLPCLSGRTRRMVETELAGGPSPNKRDVLLARREIADFVLRLSESGVIELAAEVDVSPEN